jgi:hypothetical protein
VELSEEACQKTVMKPGAVRTVQDDGLGRAVAAAMKSRG